MRHLGCDGATSTGELSMFAPNAAAAARCDARSNAACGGLLWDGCAPGFEVIGSLGRRRTSTVNEGTARLIVLVATAHRSADSPRRRRSWEARCSNANRRPLRNKLASTFMRVTKAAQKAQPMKIRDLGEVRRSDAKRRGQVVRPNSIRAK